MERSHLGGLRNELSMTYGLIAFYSKTKQLLHKVDKWNAIN